MSVLTFDKKELGNLEYSLQREMLATDRRGGYMSTTIVCCNTRKYHGLMVAPIDDSDRAYVLLSSVDETVVHDGQSFNLALHRFPGTYEPRGHKYITDFEYTPTPTITYRVGSIVLRKELLWIHNRTQLMIRYTLLEAPSDVRLRLRPFFAFRDKHALTHANMEADGRSRPIPGGVKCRLYSDFPWLYLQTDCRDAEFVPAPDWYYNFEYAREIERGYEGDEDLLTTGYFELSLGRRQSVIFSASVEAIPDPAAIGGMFADAPLWFFWVLQQLQRTLGEEEIWKRYGIVMKELLAAYRRGVGGVAVHDNGLVWASAPDKALTWMNALAGGVPVVSRDGYPVEINALWYNAVCYALELASRFGEEEFVGEWKAWPERIRNAFREMFWSGDDGYLADFVGPEGPNRWIRPNMVVACGLDYKMLDEEQQASVLRIVGQHLLTPKGLRSLSPRNPRYKNRCEGDEAVRAEASMNGSVWVWPLWFYVKASFDLGGREFLPRAEELLARFGEEIQSYGIGSINELFDGDPPHAPWGAVSQAWSVGAVLMIRETTERWRRRRGHGLLPGLRKKR
ncbi:glycogen debranching enzyme N-terminal domain-containing protein [Alistipes putredinis]|jgi:glycogen debranching enzyme|uniref:glycogen debranching enzyme N-terminal domain-containing protein n=1 Tax=Alistipes putredinis TaxID=28117 RepID=UPI00266C3F0A|nr:glycogen debranching enzyme N-terminal domain-containing protein [Alistipes putredinis]